MRTVHLSVSGRNAVRKRVLAGFSGKAQGAHISFPDIETLWRVMTVKRLRILKALAGQGPLALREIARRVERDVKAVHADVHALLDAGVLRRSEAGIEFPYDAVHVDFTLTAAA